ncbi:HDOD domain-containing protein [Thermosulfuriphilus ammonigenes]|uniref:HDOD domain-containing protein n=1 Tax=Thermosulfuriphilus ammonigenes TaxID=1936021 RepID=A0A6G7PX58_9BACT|nr:HDOD domain-containing protein [Thermosulfuriphilus ammonigenes]MBA2849659.1 putative nucleotidyltransferase with HDIG domain [Thermosulfuriphilus ammonigenes]QIJ72242.1 HDOD domain-containing protein [Thermosulfuriphilus ammonigenes]
MSYALIFLGILIFVLLFSWAKDRESKEELKEVEVDPPADPLPLWDQTLVKETVENRLRQSVKIFCLRKHRPRIVNDLSPEERERLLKGFRARALPSGASLRLSKLLKDHLADSREVSRLAATDPVLSAKLLEVANSAYCRPSGAARVTSVHRAILILGFNQVRTILFQTIFREAVMNSGELDPEEIKKLWGHSAGVSVVAGQLAMKAGLPEGQAITAGLLHDIGKFFLPPAKEDHGLSMALSPEELEIPPVVLEDKIHGNNHMIVGGLLCSFWHLPKEIVMTVAYHHLPSFSDLRGLPEGVAELVALVSIADYICHLLGFFEEEPILYELSPWVCETVGLSYPIKNLVGPEMIKELEKTQLLVSAI